MRPLARLGTGDGQPGAVLARRRTVGGGGLCGLALGGPCSAGPWAPPLHLGPLNWSGTLCGPHLGAPNLTHCLWLLDPITRCPGPPGSVSSSTLGPESCASACVSAGLGAAGECPTLPVRCHLASHLPCDRVTELWSSGLCPASFVWHLGPSCIVRCHCELPPLFRMSPPNPPNSL